MDVTFSSNLKAIITDAYQRYVTLSRRRVVEKRRRSLMRYALVRIFVKVRLRRGHAAAVALRDRLRFKYYCYRRTACPTNSKSPWFSLPLQFLHAHNKKKHQLSWKLSQSQQLLSTKNTAGRGLGLARAFPPASDLRRVSC